MVLIFTVAADSYKVQMITHGMKRTFFLHPSLHFSSTDAFAKHYVLSYILIFVCVLFN